jgi:MFS family permease
MFSIGSIISPLLISSLLFSGISYRYIFFLFAAAIFILTFFLFLNLKKMDIKKIIRENLENSAPDEKMQAPAKHEKFNIIIILSCIVMFFSMSALSGASTWFTTYMSTFDVPVAYGSIGLSIMWAVSAIVLYGSLKIFRKTNEITLLLFGGATGIIFISSVALSTNIIVKLVLLFLHAGSYACFFPMLTSIATHEARFSKGTVLGVIITCAFAGSIVFQPLLGYFAQYVGPASVIYVIIAGYFISLVFLLLLFYFLRKKYKKMRVMFRLKKHEPKKEALS